MRITFVLAGLGAGGAERVISLIANAWVAKGHEITIVSFDRPDDPVYHLFDKRIALKRLGLPPVAANAWRRMAFAIRRVLGLRRQIKTSHADVVISFLTKVNAVSLAATIGLDVPVIVSERNNPDRQAAHPLWSRMLSLLYRRASAIVMQTRASIACLPPRTRQRAVIVPNPIMVGSALGAHDMPRQSRRRFVAVGRLVSQKGFDLLIDAFAQIAHILPHWDLVIWGEGDERKQLESRIAGHRLKKRVSLPGLTQKPGVWTAGADAFVLSSRFEGFPNVLGEAMAAALPVISFDCPFGPAEMIRDGEDGLIVPAEDPRALAAAMQRIAQDETLRAQLSDAAATSARRFAPSVIIARWEEVLLTLGKAI